MLLGLGFRAFWDLGRAFLPVPIPLVVSLPGLTALPVTHQHIRPIEWTLPMCVP